MPRFVILEHDHHHLHWDLMLEAGEVLQTWRLAQPPIEPPCVIAATILGDHRRIYLEYEGPVSGDRGTVQRWDAGTYVDQADSTPQKRHLLFEGVRVSGSVWLVSITGEIWQFHWTDSGKGAPLPIRGGGNACSSVLP
jgi:DNA polymerase Ligase (LigD)